MKLGSKEITFTDRNLLVGSVVLNIFLLAFVVGRASMMPPPPPPPHHHPPSFARPDFPPLLPPPLFKASDLFSQEEIRQQLDTLKDDFEKSRQSRTAFVKKLQSGPVSKEEVQQQFQEVDELMTKIRDTMQSQMAERVAQLTPEQRGKLAERMLREGPGFGRPPHGPGGPGGMPPRSRGHGRMHGSAGHDMPPPPPEEAPLEPEGAPEQPVTQP